jgi:hypothetical protein
MRLRSFITITILLSGVAACNNRNTTGENPEQLKGCYIGVSSVNPAYFSFSDGKTYIPVGINMINPSGKYHSKPDSAFIEIERWMSSLAANGGNYIRIWLSESFWDMEDSKAGQYSEEKIRRIDRFVELARKYNLRIKITLEHFRSVTLEENNQSWATKFVYHTSHGGPLDSVRQYLTTGEGRNLFLSKADFYRQRYGADTLFFGWELWNEMNAMHGPQDTVFFEWNSTMLGEVKARFPENLVMQSFGSFDNEEVRPAYRKLMLLPGNEVAQIHRYLDPGADLEVCQAPMDIICSSAIDEILSYNTGKPVLLAETGAVESRHSGPSKLYAADTAGILLHDILFAPFFSGSAGTGMCWHWESYVDRNNLWHHFGRFTEAIKGVDPVAENFVPSRAEKDNMRIYILKGTRTILMWIRDSRNNWKSEIEDNQAAPVNQAAVLDMGVLGISDRYRHISVYDPWKNRWENAEQNGGSIKLPGFRRSVVVKLSE